MTTCSDSAVAQRPCGTTPAEIADRLPTRPVLTSAGHGWDGVTLQRYQILPGVIDFPPPRDHRLVIHLSGAALIEGTTNGHRERWWFDSGCAALTPACLPVTRSIKGRVDIMHIYLAPALVEEVAAEAYGADPARVHLLERVAVFDELLNQLGRLLLVEAEAHAPGGRLVANTLARALAVHLLRRHSSLAPQASEAFKPPGSAMPGWQLRRVIEHMHAHLAEDLSLAQLAAVGGLGPSRFAHAFRAATGEPPHRFLVRLRVERARDLLERTALPVLEIGLRCGFGQPNHFATMFRKLTGMSPSAYRTARRT